MRLFKLKTSRLALILAVVTLAIHLGTGYLLAAVLKNQMLTGMWQRSLKIYWPALDLIQIFRLNVNVGFLTATASMILAALLQWWVIFTASIWAIRFYFREPQITTKQKIATIATASIVVFCFFKMSPDALGDPRSPLERAIESSDTNAVEKILKSNPAFANKLFRFGNQTPLFRAAECNNPKANIDLLIKNGADINAKSGGFNLTPLQQAAWSGKLEAVKALLAHKPDVNATTESGDTALTYAFVADSKEIFNLLLDNGADINHGRSALAECMIYGGGKDSWPEFLLSKGADPNRKGTDADRFVPIIQAIINGNTNYVAALLKYHVDLNTRYLNGADNFSPLELAMDEGHLDIALMLQNYVLQSRSNTVSFAAANGDLDAIRNLLQKSPQSIEEKDELGFTPLAWAAKAGQKDAVSLLLSLGANANATNSGGRYPIGGTSKDTIELLFAKGAVISERPGYWTIFQHWALGAGDTKIATVLLAHGANVNAKDSEGKTALHFAAQQGTLQAVEWLLKNGAEVNARDNKGVTPLSLTKFRNRGREVEKRKDVADLLRKYGAKD